jgi:phospholipid transport system substrate-binding protein
MSVKFSRRRGVLRLAFSVGLLMSVFARSGIAFDASAPIEQLDAGLLQVMKLGKTAPFRQRYDLLAPLVVRAVDLDLILQSALGSSWTSIPPDQQAMLTSAFQRYSIATYVAQFDEYAGERFDLLPPTTGASGGPIIRVKIVPGRPGDETHVLGYSMRQVGGAWKAVEVTADGSISQVVAQQAEIRSLFTRHGAFGLLGRLQEKTIELSGGALR